MVLPVNNGNISLSCTTYSQLSVQHARRPQALASCIDWHLICMFRVLSLLSIKHNKQKYDEKKLDKAKFTLQACLKMT